MTLHRDLDEMGILVHKVCLMGLRMTLLGIVSIQLHNIFLLFADLHKHFTLCTSPHKYLFGC